MLSAYPPMMVRNTCILILALLLLSCGCSSPAGESPVPADRTAAIPAGAAKITPGDDAYPPLLHSDDYQTPVPLPRTINTAGAEDSAFILPDKKTLYFFFTPDPNIPAEKQLRDGVTGIHVARKKGTAWSEPERVMLQDRRKLALDGCAFVQ